MEQSEPNQIFEVFLHLSREPSRWIKTRLCPRGIRYALLMDMLSNHHSISKGTDAFITIDIEAEAAIK